MTGALMSTVPTMEAYLCNRLLGCHITCLWPALPKAAQNDLEMVHGHGKHGLIPRHVQVSLLGWPDRTQPLGLMGMTGMIPSSRCLKSSGNA